MYDKVSAVVRFVHNLSKRTGINHKDKKCFIVVKLGISQVWVRRGGLLGDPIWVRSCYFLPPFENILFKIRIFYICGIEIFVRTATLLLPSCL